MCRRQPLHGLVKWRSQRFIWGGGCGTACHVPCSSYRRLIVEWDFWGTFYIKHFYSTPTSKILQRTSSLNIKNIYYNNPIKNHSDDTVHHIQNWWFFVAQRFLDLVNSGAINIFIQKPDNHVRCRSSLLLFNTPKTSSRNETYLEKVFQSNQN